MTSSVLLYSLCQADVEVSTYQPSCSWCLFFWDPIGIPPLLLDPTPLPQDHSIFRWACCNPKIVSARARRYRAPLVPQLPYGSSGTRGIGILTAVGPTANTSFSSSVSGCDLCMPRQCEGPWRAAWLQKKPEPWAWLALLSCSCDPRAPAGVYWAEDQLVTGQKPTSGVEGTWL